jgi:hypothetical protein
VDSTYQPQWPQWLAVFPGENLGVAGPTIYLSLREVRGIQAYPLVRWHRVSLTRKCFRHHNGRTGKSTWFAVGRSAKYEVPSPTTAHRPVPCLHAPLLQLRKKAWMPSSWSNKAKLPASAQEATFYFLCFFNFTFFILPPLLRLFL